MRRDHFALEIDNIEWVDGDTEPRQPSLRVIFDGDADPLHRRLAGTDGTPLDDGDVDVSVRFQTSPDDPDADGVLALTNRVTGDYALEVNVTAAAILPFVTAARRYGKRTDDECRYRVDIIGDEGPLRRYEKRTLLVYSDESGLLRSHSLIPSGVEI